MFREERYIQIKMELLIRRRCYIKTFLKSAPCYRLILFS